MGTKKPIIQFILDETNYKKFQAICEKNERTQSKMAGLIVKNYIEQHEKLNGEIKIKE